MKIIYLIVLSFFIFVSLGFCGDDCIVKDLSHHCMACCSAGHIITISTDGAIPSPNLSVSKAIIIQDDFYKTLIVLSIEHPPQNI
ncbi:MAG: hypothetical protein LHV68_06270 [Elusimicrobia bacterium]|nr:hypothetical protein [Candidatus Liberimonas magnetica]